MTEPLQWIAFNVFVLLMLALDLAVFHRKSHEVKIREALTWTFVWILLALIFNYCIYHFWGKERALEFLTGYLIEKSLSVDNLFVFVLIFTYFDVPAAYQHKVLFWGIIGALIMRVIFIFAGVALISQFHWIIYLFAGFLVFTGIRMLVRKHKKIDPNRNIVVRTFKKLFPVTETFQGNKFFVKIDGKKFATPLFLVVVMIELSDLIFAVDSIPAILAISHDRFIIYTSNVFAILGLRSLYFVLARLPEYFRFLKYGLALILVFVGVKMFMSDIYKIPTAIALAVIAGIILISVLLSLFIKEKDATSTNI